MITPNKQNLLAQKKQIKIVQNGLKLLKEKRTGLVSKFLELAKKGKLLESELNKDQKQVFSIYTEAMTFASVASLKNSLPDDADIQIQVEKKRVSGVYLENINIAVSAPFRSQLKTPTAYSLTKFSHLFPDLVMLIQLKMNVEKISVEIEKTNRLINNLENKVIEIQGQIKYINAVLSDKRKSRKSYSNQIIRLN